VLLYIGLGIMVLNPTQALMVTTVICKYIVYLIH